MQMHNAQEYEPFSAASLARSLPSCGQKKYSLKANTMIEDYQSPLQPQEQLESIINPHSHDVLSGRGNFVNHHFGNENFRKL
jgi:hypothetical protein